MRDTELYRHLLGLETPWKVGRVELSATDGRVDVWVEHPARTRFACPDCEHELAVYDHSEERAWQHLDSCAFLTFLHASPPRVKCSEHGVSQVRLPWAEPHSRFTTLFAGATFTVDLPIAEARADESPVTGASART